MRLRPVDIGVIAAAGLVMLLVFLLPSPRDRNPAVPSTPEHRAIPAVEDCLKCHASGASQPLSTRHPKRKDCFRCHREPQKN